MTRHRPISTTRCRCLPVTNGKRLLSTARMSRKGQRNATRPARATNRGSESGGEPTALIDRTFGVEFTRDICAADKVRLDARSLQRFLQLAKRNLPCAHYDVVDI